MSTPVRGIASATADSADEEEGSVIDSAPAALVTGTTTSSVSVARPGREISTRGGVPLTIVVWRPSRRASRTRMPWRDLHAHPALLQHVHGEACLANCRVAGGAQVVVDA